MKISEVNIELVLTKILEKAEKLRTDAAYGGDMHDGGASDLRALVAIFRCGMNGDIPHDWFEYAEQVRNEADPEWAEYQRLQAKFEGK